QGGDDAGHCPGNGEIALDLMPIAIATCWLSATARMATPMRLLRKNHVNSARKARDTITPTTWIGGMTAVHSEIGSSPIGSGRDLVWAPMVIGGRPRRMAASAVVAMNPASITNSP